MSDSHRLRKCVSGMQSSSYILNISQTMLLITTRLEQYAPLGHISNKLAGYHSVDLPSISSMGGPDLSQRTR